MLNDIEPTTAMLGAKFYKILFTVSIGMILLGLAASFAIDWLVGAVFILFGIAGALMSSGPHTTPK